jgi:hypothetical protein
MRGTMKKTANAARITSRTARATIRINPPF